MNKYAKFMPLLTLVAFTIAGGSFAVAGKLALSVFAPFAIIMALVGMYIAIGDAAVAAPAYCKQWVADLKANF